MARILALANQKGGVGKTTSAILQTAGNLTIAPQTTVSGLYASQPNRATARPITERVLEAFRNLTLTVVHLPGQIFRHFTPLSALQHRLLALAGLDPICYGRLTVHSSEPPG